MMLKFHTECIPGGHRAFIEMVFYEIWTSYVRPLNETY